MHQALWQVCVFPNVLLPCAAAVLWMFALMPLMCVVAHTLLHVGLVGYVLVGSCFLVGTAAFNGSGCSWYNTMHACRCRAA